jgi:hypothetical protein
MALRAASAYDVSRAAHCAEAPTRRCARIGRTREQLPAWNTSPAEAAGLAT